MNSAILVVQRPSMNSNSIASLCLNCLYGIVKLRHTNVLEKSQSMNMYIYDMTFLKLVLSTC